jgi:hypothetical protein
MAAVFGTRKSCLLPRAVPSRLPPCGGFHLHVFKCKG